MMKIRIAGFLILSLSILLVVSPALAQGPGHGVMPVPPPPGMMPPPPPPGVPGMIPPPPPARPGGFQQGMPGPRPWPGSKGFTPGPQRPGSPAGGFSGRTTGDALVLRAMKLLEKSIRQLGRSEKPRDRQAALAATRNLLAVAILLRDGRVDGALKRLDSGTAGRGAAGPPQKAKAKNAKAPAGKQKAKAQAGKPNAKPPKAKNANPRRRLAKARRKLARLDCELQWMEAKREQLRQEVHRLQAAENRRRENRERQRQRDLVRKEALNRTRIRSMQMELAHLEETGKGTKDPSWREKSFQLRRKIFELEEAGNVLRREKAWLQEDQHREVMETQQRDRGRLENQVFELEQESLIQDRELDRRLEVLRRRLHALPGEVQPGR